MIVLKCLRILLFVAFLFTILPSAHSQDGEVEKANALNQQVIKLYNQGNYQEAIKLANQVLAIREKALGPEHPYMAASLNNLALLYKKLGDYKKAEPLYKRSLAIREKVLGPEHPEVAQSLNNLALLYSDLGDYEKAEPLLKRALAIRENVLGPEHPEVAQSLNNLAFLYNLIGNNAQAEPLLKRALTIKEKVLGPEHPDVAQSLNNLACLYDDLGDYEKAEPLFKRALAIDEKNLGPEHPDVAESLNNLANLYAALGNFQKAHHLYKKAQRIDGKLIDQVMGFTAEEQKMKFLSTKKSNLYAFISFVEQYFSLKPSARKDALDVWLARKGIILEAQKRFQEALIYAEDPQVFITFQQLSAVRSKLSKLTFSGPGDEGPEMYKKEIARLEKHKSELESRLSTLSKAFALKQKVSKADCVKVAKALPKNTTLLEFARIGKVNFKAKGQEKRWPSDYYIAFIIHAGRGRKPGMIALGNADEIDKAVSQLKQAIEDSRNIIYPFKADASKKLYKLVFKPLLTELGNKKEIFISPDGNLNLVPFEVLQSPEGRFLIEDYTFTYLAAGRDIVGFGEIKEKGGKALLMGDPDFDMGQEEKDSSVRNLALRRVDDTEKHLRAADMRGFHFSKLPATREEVKTISELLGKDNAEVYMGQQALEEVLRQTETPSILHLATHGFFLSDFELQSAPNDHLNSGIANQFAKTSKGPGARKINIKNPLLRSGIALAGANNVLRANDTAKSDGIVTAEKVLGLKLRGTDMVVLSACDTGVGEVKTGEGVFGLRRAFTQAGAKSLVMSMWSVPDVETKELMVNFYRNVKTEKMSRSKALRQATLEQMQIVKQRYGHANPHYWGAFVFMGEP